jgi:hypothetical protein
MKSTQILTGIAALSASLSGFGADAVSTWSWGFEASDNPAITKPTDGNPFAGTGTATISVGTGEGYFADVVELSNLTGLNFGTATGVWDVLSNASGTAIGGATLGIDLYAPSPEALLDYTVVIRHFASTPVGGFQPYPGTVNFSIGGSTKVSETVVQNVPGAGGGSWIESTYAWENLSVNGPITLTLSSDPARGLLLDSIAFSVMGDLVPIPEPSVTQLGALAALLLGVGAFRRTRTTAA